MEETKEHGKTCSPPSSLSSVPCFSSLFLLSPQGVPSVSVLDSGSLSLLWPLPFWVHEKQPADSVISFSHIFVPVTWTSLPGKTNHITINTPLVIVLR